jgi:hypothetical protein
MTVYGCTVSLKAEVLPELKLKGHKYKKKKKPLCRYKDTQLTLRRKN